MRVKTSQPNSKVFPSEAVPITTGIQKLCSVLVVMETQLVTLTNSAVAYQANVQREEVVGGSQSTWNSPHREHANITLNALGQNHGPQLC